MAQKNLDTPKTKSCVRCGRRMTFRRRWAKNWSQIKYCSDQCRNSGSKNTHEEEILALLKKRGAGKTICPSEILPDELKQNSKAMEAVRQAARRLVAKNQIIIMQKGHEVDPSTAKGPIRLKLKSGTSQ